jgi:hypothetical protein
MNIADRHDWLTRRVFLRLTGLAAVAAPFRESRAADEIVGAVSEIRGQAQAVLNKRRRKLKVRSSVFLGDTLSTGAKSRLRAFLARRTSLRLGAQTTVRIDAYIVNKGGELALGNGALLLDTQSDRFSKELAIESPFALIAVRGTRIFAGDIEGTFGVFVAKGSVDVTAGGQTVALAAGEGTDIARPGDPPGPVRRWGQPKIAKAMALVN